MKYVQTHFLKENVCAHHVFLCALISQPHAHSLEGTLPAIANRLENDSKFRQIR